ncbi:MAG: cell division protein ZapB [Acidobacteriota bacterium]
MDVFDALEQRLTRLIEAYRGLEARVRELEEENRGLREGSGDLDTLKARISQLEAERDGVRQRLERVLEKFESLDL